jgi:hypothetical protein
VGVLRRIGKWICRGRKTTLFQEAHLVHPANATREGWWWTATFLVLPVCWLVVCGARLSLLVFGGRASCVDRLRVQGGGHTVERSSSGVWFKIVPLCGVPPWCCRVCDKFAPTTDDRPRISTILDHTPLLNEVSLSHSTDTGSIGRSLAGYRLPCRSPITKHGGVRPMDSNTSSTRGSRRIRCLVLPTDRLAKSPDCRPSTWSGAGNTAHWSQWSGHLHQTGGSKNTHSHSHTQVYTRRESCALHDPILSSCFLQHQRAK